MTTATGSPVRRAVRLASFAGLALLAEPLTGIADTAAAGALGVEDQASLALGAGVVMATTWLIVPVLFAQTTMVARLYVSGRVGEAARAVVGGLLAAAAVGAVVAAALVFIAVFVDISSDARGYLLARAGGMPVMAIVMSGYGALRGSNGVRTVTVVALGGAAVHVALDVVVVAYTGLGIAGLGLASALSQVVVALLVLHALRTRGLLPLSVRGLRSVAWRSSATAVGLLAARAAVLGLTILTLTATAVSIGSVEGAAHQVTFQFWLFAVLAVEGWKSAAQILVSSSTTPEEQRQVEQTMMRCSVVLGLGAALVTLACTPVIGLLAANDDVTELARTIWWPAALSLALGAIAYTRDGIEYGHAEYAANLVRILPGTLIWLVGAWIAHSTGRVEWIWWGITAGLLVRALWASGTPNRPEISRTRTTGNARDGCHRTRIRWSR